MNGIVDPGCTVDGTFIWLVTNGLCQRWSHQRRFYNTPEGLCDWLLWITSHPTFILFPYNLTFSFSLPSHSSDYALLFSHTHHHQSTSHCSTISPLYPFFSVHNSSSPPPCSPCQMESLFGSLPEMLDFQRVFLQTLEERTASKPDFSTLETPSQFKVQKLIVVFIPFYRLKLNTISAHLTGNRSYFSHKKMWLLSFGDL